MDPMSDSEKKHLSDALILLRDAIDVRLVTAGDLIFFLKKKVEARRNGNNGQNGDSRQNRHRRPYQQQHHQRQHTHHHHKHHATNMIIVECAYCLGLGFGRGSRSCPICKGARMIKVPANSVECGSCHGMGKWLGEKPCRSCGGTGRAIIRSFH
jgi:hypothetical protein